MRNWPLQILALSIAFCSSQTATAAISRVTFKNDSRNSYYSLKYSQLSPHFRIFLDTDMLASTGFRVGKLGANFMLENGKLYRYAGHNGSWKWTLVKKIQFSLANMTARFKVAKADIGNPTTLRLVADCTVAGCISKVVDQQLSGPLPPHSR